MLAELNAGVDELPWVDTRLDGNAIVVRDSIIAGEAHRRGTNASFAAQGDEVFATRNSFLVGSDFVVERADLLVLTFDLRLVSVVVNCRVENVFQLCGGKGHCELPQ